MRPGRDLDAAADALRRVSSASVDQGDTCAQTTRARVLATVARRRLMRSRALTALAVVAFGLGGATAWAWTTGRLGRLSESWAASNAPASVTPPRAPRRAGLPVVTPTATDLPSVVDAAADVAAIEQAVGDAFEGSGPVATPRARAPSRTRAAAAAPPPRGEVPAPTPLEARREAEGPTELTVYGEAHRTHFGARDAARAVDAWDRYLAAFPSGRLVPEAQFNRAVALLEAGRFREAASAFEEVTRGGYRTDDARRLLERALRGAEGAQARP